MARTLVRTIALPQAIALYAGAVIGAGVLLLPGMAASLAGPASIVAWGFDALLGALLAGAFAALAVRMPEPGGVATYTARAFGGAAGAAVGWMYFIGAAIGQIIVPLAGAAYLAGPLGLDRTGTFIAAGLILAAPVAANLRGLRVSGNLALALAGMVALLLLTASLISLPHQSLAAWTPFAPHGWVAVGQAAVLLFFAFSGWEAIAPLAAEFRNPRRDIPRATIWGVALVTALYLAVAAATIGARVYGSPGVDSVSVALLLGGGLGAGASAIAAVVAVVVCLGTINAFIAGAARLAYGLARERAAPDWLGGLDAHGTPSAGVWLIGLFAGCGLILTYFAHLSLDFWLALPNTLVLLTYILGMAAGARLLRGAGRALAIATLVMCLVALPFAGIALGPALLIALAAVGYRWARLRRAEPASAPALEVGERRRSRMTDEPRPAARAPLEGIRVLDLTRLLPGPFAGQTLAELGADVVKVEEPGLGDGSRFLLPLVNGVGLGFLATNRGKRSIVLNLKAPAGREALLRLVDSADILLEGFRPGTLARLGLGYEALRARNPRLIICAITGYGQQGPYSQRAGHDLNYLGYSGLLGHLARPGAPPHNPGAQFADIAGGAMMAVIGTLAALVARGVSGQGQVVDVSMLDGSMALAPLLMSGAAHGLTEAAPGAGLLTGALPGYNVYETADGRYVTLAALEPKFWAEFCRRAGRPDLEPHHYPRDDGDRDATIRELVTLFRAKTRDEWLALLADADACLGPVNTIVEALADQQVQARGVIAEQTDGAPLLRSVPLLSDAPPRLLGPAPRLGEHTAAVLAEAGYSPDEIAALVASGAAQVAQAE